MDPNSSVFQDVDQWYFNKDGLFSEAPASYDDLRFIVDNSSAESMQQYLFCIYWTFFYFVTSTLTTVGYGELNGKSQVERGILAFT